MTKYTCTLTIIRKEVPSWMSACGTTTFAVLSFIHSCATNKLLLDKYEFLYIDKY